MSYTPRSASALLNPVLTKLQIWQQDEQPRAIADLEALAKQNGSESRQVIESWIAMTGVKLGSPLQVFVPLVEFVNDKENRGRLVECELTLVETKPAFAGYTRWVMKPVHDKPFRKVKKDFLESLDHARQAVIALDAENSLWPDYQPWVIQYHFKGLAAEEEIGGSSAGCIMALGAALLLARNMPRAAHRYHFILAELSRQVLFDKFTATACITKDGRLTHVEGTQIKLGTAGRVKITHFIISREQAFHLEPPLPIWSRFLAWSRQCVPCSTLSEALHAIVIGSGADPSFRFRKNRRRAFSVMAATLLGIAAFFYFGFRSPPKEWLSYRMSDNDVAVTDLTTPDRISTVSVHIPTTTDYKWVNHHLPPLKGLHWPPFLRMQRTFDLTLGRMWSPDKAKDSVTLADFGSLKSLRQLTLLQGPVTQLQGAETLHELEAFISLGGRVSDLRWLTQCQWLKLLVLDSGFIEDYPSLSFPQLETLIARLPASEDIGNILTFAHLPSLRRLALRADKVKDIRFLSRFTSLEQLILYLEEAEPNLLKFPLPNRIRSLELARCAWLREIDIGKAARAIKVLLLTGTRLEKLYLGNASQLKVLQIESDSFLETLDLTGLAQLETLILKDCVIKEIKGLATCARLRQIEIESLDELVTLDLKDTKSLEILHVVSSGLRTLKSLHDCQNLKTLILEQCPMEKLPGLEKVRQLQIIYLKAARVTQLEDLINLDHLQTIDLSSSPIGKLPELSPKARINILLEGTDAAKKLAPISRLVWLGNQISKSNLIAIDRPGLAHLRSGSYYIETQGLEYGGYSYYEYTPIYKYEYMLNMPTGSYHFKHNQIIPAHKTVQFDGWPPEDTLPEPPSFETRNIMQLFAPHIQLPKSFELPYWMSDSESKAEKPFERRSAQPEAEKKDLENGQ